jgi:Rnk N-terminus
MRERAIYVTEFDLKRLSNLLNGTRSWNKKDRDYLIKLEEELEWAQIVAPQADVGTLFINAVTARLKRRGRALMRARPESSLGSESDFSEPPPTPVIGGWPEAGLEPPRGP